MRIIQDRRRFLTNMSALGAASFINVRNSSAAEPPPETTTLRIRQADPGNAVCEVFKYVARELLTIEGFTDISYPERGSPGGLDFDTDFAPGWINWIEIDGEPWDEPWTVLTGLHSGCLQLIANESIQTIPDLKGKRVGVPSLISTGRQLLALMTAYVGLDPAKDIEWIAGGEANATAMQLFADGKIDAFLGSPPEPEELFAHNIGHSILNTGIDPPWSQYFCCLLGCRNDFMNQYPVATKRVVRAFLKAIDICQSQPSVAARSAVDNGITQNYDYAFAGLTGARYDRWRDFDPEDTMRFYSLRMQEVGFIKSSPHEIIARGTNWQFLNELKRELKA